VLASAYNVHGVLILPADIPLFDPLELQSMVQKSHDMPVVVIAPDRHNEGTNALLLAPPDVIDFDYGPDSFSRHCDQAREAGVLLEVCELSSLALDVDWPADLEFLSENLKIEIGMGFSG
jgi:2-phospho-L-lactate guanylyltransferase